jgi:hypothetical protein
MKPDAKYLFERAMPKGHLMMREHTGITIPDFPAIWFPTNEQHSAIGLKYIRIKDGPKQFPSLQFTHTLLLGKDISTDTMRIDINYLPAFPHPCYGDFREDALLVQFREESHNFNLPEKTWANIWFFKGKKQQSEILYHQWLAGKLVLEDEITKYIFKKMYSFYYEPAETSNSPHHILSKS